MMLARQQEKWLKPNKDQTSSVVGLRTAVGSLHQLLLQQRGYSTLIETAIARNPDVTHPWSWIPLIQIQQLNAGLLTTFRFSSQPIHDHPGSSGALLVIRGRIRIHRFNYQDPGTYSQSILKLERLDSDTLSAGDTDGHTTNLANIHQLENETSRCLLLCMHSPPIDERNRSWFLPVEPFPRRMPTLLVKRVNRRS
jgi:hypothetical protein